jgi:hypothetical protein
MHRSSDKGRDSDAVLDVSGGAILDVDGVKNVGEVQRLEVE